MKTACKIDFLSIPISFFRIYTPYVNIYVCEHVWIKYKCVIFVLPWWGRSVMRLRVWCMMKGKSLVISKVQGTHSCINIPQLYIAERLAVRKDLWINTSTTQQIKQNSNFLLYIILSTYIAKCLNYIKFLSAVISHIWHTFPCNLNPNYHIT